MAFLTCFVEAKIQSITTLGCVFTDLGLSSFAQSLLLQRRLPSWPAESPAACVASSK